MTSCTNRRGRPTEDPWPFPEWYTGTDTSGEVARTIETIIERMDAESADHDDIDRLHQLLEREGDINWRSFLLGLAGTVHYELEEEEAALTVLTRSIEGYRVFLPSFDGVINVYTQSCYTLGVILHDAGRFADAVPFLLRCLPFLHEVFDEVYSANVHMFLESCFAEIGQTNEALVFAEAASFAQPDDCETLERLMVAYGAAGRRDKAIEAFHLLAEKCRDHSCYARAAEWAERHLGETGTVN